MSVPYYLKIGKASDLKDKKERRIYRALEMFPGLLSWTTLILIVVLSWLKPLWMAVFVISFVIYWLFRTSYFSFHLSASYKQMRKNKKTDWMEKIKSLPGTRWEDIYHVVVFPVYKEPLEIIRSSLDSVFKNDYPKEKMIVVLSCEEKAGEEGRQMARDIEKEFKDKFFKLFITFHPSDIPGELAGKGSNETWGMKRAKEEIIDPLNIPYEKIIVSSLDGDTSCFPKYFSCLTYSYLTVEDSTRASFQPIPLFTNNIWEAPPISRMFSFSATFWQMMCQERPEKLLTFSSHSMSFKALVDVDFRQVNAVSDDSRIFWQCFLKYDGDYRVVPLNYPIAMDANVAKSFSQTMKNVYKQQRRWAYGAADIAYFFFAFRKNKKIPLKKEFFMALSIIEGHWSWATNSIIIFLLGWLPLILGGEEFSRSLLSYNLPIFTSRGLTLAMLGLLGSAYYTIMMLPPKPPLYKKRKYLFFALEWLLLPVVMIFFTSFPSLEAQTRLLMGKYMGFWTTPKIRKQQ
jgi:cellulose synthase/poly-beta-1,6-N-acetylglucosamine synthase-like glycosyltransferase